MLLIIGFFLPKPHSHSRHPFTEGNQEASSEIVRGSLVKGDENSSSNPIAAAAVIKKSITTDATYSGEEELALLAATRGVQSHLPKQIETEGDWQQVKSRAAIMKEKMVAQAPLVAGEGRESSLR